MRVTLGMLTATTLRNLQTINSRLFRLQDQLTSGHRITRPSDDPVGAAQTVRHQQHLDRIEQYLTTIGDATAWLNATDQALASASDLLGRARELAVQGANGALSAGDQQAIAQEVDHLVRQMVSVANSMIGDRYLFGGYKTATPPFAPDGAVAASVTYQGDAGEIRRQIGDQTTITVNLGGGGPFPQVFATLIALRDRLAAGNPAGVSALLTDIEAAVDGLAAARALTGARLNQVERAATHLEMLKVNVTAALSATRDLDYSAGLVSYAADQTLYKAALEIGGRVVQPSLLDYLR